MCTHDVKVPTSANLRGKVFVLAFWATLCARCRQELQRVEKVYTSYKDNQDVLFWAVNAHALLRSSKPLPRSTCVFRIRSSMMRFP
jgi:thiol-disulfide isomerase/thioredoxin